MDVKITFLNGELKEEIYMCQLQKYEVEGKKGKTYKLNKFLYGIEQFSRQWCHTFHNTIISYSFVPNNYDYCIFGI